MIEDHEAFMNDIRLARGRLMELSYMMDQLQKKIDSLRFYMESCIDLRDSLASTINRICEKCKEN